MTAIGYFLSSEEHGPDALVDRPSGRGGGFGSVWISDHFHPWIDAQGRAPSCGASSARIAAATELTVTTAVTCPTVRVHPAVIAQAAATSAVMIAGRFRFGVGTGENLNEHILGDRGREADMRLEMLEEAVAVIRALWTGEHGESLGQALPVENARIYTAARPTAARDVSGFGPKATSCAARIGDG